MDGYVVVVPAQGYEVFGVGGAALAPWGDVVDLESVAAAAAGDGAPVSVSVNDGPTEGGWDGS